MFHIYYSMKIGILKSKVEKFLVESMSNNTFKSEIKTFKSLVLEDKDIAKAFYIYDVLDRKKGMSKDDANSLIDECIRQFEKLNLNDKKLSKLNSWVGKTKLSENSYKQIDNILDTDNILFETILESKKNLIKAITKVIWNVLANYRARVNLSSMKTWKRMITMTY